ncbi:DUF4145 domain-containing protein [Sporosarcina sp. ACRSM]|uniref:DUF4145 domain-containing protein n=1 Tax=Sporosarcina sp. ACRSM TaxID=2918216 RepID=UPI001EF5A742|nr:DUF4145 domain-containing protein [Sporosarcina sp. ACRSM]
MWKNKTINRISQGRRNCHTEKPSYFYQFLEPLSKELAYVAREQENSIFASLRTVLTHATAFVENILQQVIKAEKQPDEPWANLKERLELLNEKGYLTPEIRDVLHHVLQIGNKAAHDARLFRNKPGCLCRALFSKYATIDEKRKKPTESTAGWLLYVFI